MREATNWDQVFKEIVIASAHRKYDTVFQDDGDLYRMTTPSEKASWANGVLYSNFDGIENRERVVKVIQGYRDLWVSFKWLVGPGDQTEKLSNVLKELGLKYEYDCVGMVRNTEPLTGEKNKEIEVVNISPERAKDFVEATMGGWDMPDEYFAPMCENIRRQIAEEKEEYFVARDGGRPVGSGILAMFGDFGYLKRGSVIPEYRGRGVFKALVAKRLDVLCERGVSNALVLAKSDTSAPICIRFGFETVNRIQYFFEQR